jgi:hypothetical protein
MLYYYQAYGIPLVSEIELPDLVTIPGKEPLENFIDVKWGKAPQELENSPQETKPFSQYNENEFL